MNQQIKPKVYQVFSAAMDIPVESITDDISPDSFETWDSLKHMNLVLSLEEEFEIELTDEQTLEMQNVALIVMVIEEALGTP